MDTKMLTWNEKKEAAALLKKGELVAFPTETVYGLGGIASSEEAFKKLVEAKRRSPEKPFTLMCSSLTQAVGYVEIDVKAAAVMQAFMPGQITLLCKPRESVPEWVHLASPYIGIRIPDNPEVLELIDFVNEPLLVPSANLAGDPACLTADSVKKIFGGKIAGIVEGECASGEASTIVALSENGLQLIRKGPVPFEEIQGVYDSASLSVSLGADHGGYALKESIKKHLKERGFVVLDEGTNDISSVDYPIYGEKAARDVAEKKAKLGIVVCTSGEGIMMAANKVPGIRCGLGYDDVATGKCREHNNANMIAFGQSYMKEEDVLRRVDIFLTEKFSALEKHHRRVEEIAKIC